MFFKKTFLLADINLDIALEISFFILNNVEIDFVGYHLYQKIYTAAEALLITRQIKLIRKKQFIIVGSDLKDEVFIIHIIFISKDSDTYTS